jgi:hypothetical protein
MPTALMLARWPMPPLQGLAGCPPLCCTGAGAHLLMLYALVLHHIVSKLECGLLRLDLLRLLL